MKKFMGTRIGVILVTMLACMVVFGGMAFAASYNKDVPTSVTFKATAPGLTIYSDAGCNTELTSLNLGEIDSGGSNDILVYAKNTGNKAFTGLTVNSNLDSAIGTVTGFGLNPLPKGQSISVGLRIATVSLMTDYNTPFTITIGGDY